MGNRVNVRIHGQEYTIIGEKPKDKILQIAAYVDERIGEIYDASNIPTMSTLAVLSAVNITEELFEMAEKGEELKAETRQAQNEVQKYMELWKEAKKNFDDYKEENLKMYEQNKNLIKELNEAREAAEVAMAENIKTELSSEMVGEFQEMETKYKELESNFFDLQMENFQLKSELEKSKMSMTETNEDF